MRRGHLLGLSLQTISRCFAQIISANEEKDILLKKWEE